MSQFKYEKLILDTAKALQCFIEEYKRDRPKFLNNNNNNNNQQQPQIGELTEDKVKLITTYALLNLTNVNNQKDFNLAVERYLNDLRTSEDGKTYVRYNNTWKEVNLNDLQGRPGRDSYTPYIQNGKWFLNNVDLGVNATGESAYDIAKRLNKPNTDSEENWVNSLKGNKGEQGEKGLKGDKGTGISSITLSNETDKTYLNINLEDNTNSKLLLPLLKGDKGEPGRDVDPAIINRLNQAINNKVDKVDGKQLSTNDFTTAEKQKLESIDLSTKLDKGTYSGTAKDLNDKIEQILTLLRSNNVNLDTLQEIVDYITLNRTKLEALGISNIAGLTQALSDKAPLNHNHDDRYMLKEHKPTWNDIQNKPDNLANSGNIQDLQRKIDQINSVLSQKASVNHTHNWNDIQSKPSINKSGNVYTIPGLGGNIEIPSWVTQTKPTYDWSEIGNKPSLNYLPLSGGVLTPGDVVWYDGLKIAKSTAGWSTFLLGSSGNLDNTSWMIARNPKGQLMIQSTDNGLDTGLLLSNDFLKWKGSTFSVTKEGEVHANKMLESPKLLLHVSEVDYVSLNSKDYKLNVKDGAAGRDSGEFKPVLASGYEIPNGKQTRLLAADGQNYGLGVGQKQTINLKGLNESKYYLVYCNVSTADRVRVRVHNALHYTSNPSWTTHAGGFSLVLDFEQTGNGWGTIHTDIVINQYYYLWTNVHPVMRVDQLANSNTMFMYLRGGGEYYIYQWSQVGNSDSWVNPRKDNGNYEVLGQSIPYCTDWDENLKVVVRKFIADKNALYGEWTKYNGKIISKGVVVENYPDTARFQLTSNEAEMFVTTENLTNFVKVRAGGYKVNGSDDNHLLLAGGGTIHRKNLVSKVIQVTTPTFDITGDNVGQTAHVATNCVLNYNTMPELSTFAVRKVYDGGSVTFSGSLPPIYTGDTVLNGKKGSTAIIDYGLNNQIFIDIRNI